MMQPFNRECAFGLSERGRGGSRLPVCILRSSSRKWCGQRLITCKGGVLCHCVIAKLVISRFPTKVGDLQTQWVSLMKRLKRKTKHGFKELLRLCVSDSVTSPIRITDRLNHSESNIDLHKSEYKCIVLVICRVY